MSGWIRKGRGHYFALLPWGTWIARSTMRYENAGPRAKWSLFFLPIDGSIERHGHFTRLRGVKKYAASPVCGVGYPNKEPEKQ